MKEKTSRCRIYKLVIESHRHSSQEEKARRLKKTRKRKRKMILIREYHFILLDWYYRLAIDR